MESDMVKRTTEQIILLVHDNKTHDAVLAKILFQRWIGIYHNLVGRLCTASATCCHALLEQREMISSGASVLEIERMRFEQQRLQLL